MNSKLLLLLFCVVLFASSCVQQSDMLTVIKSDGSCYKEFAENADEEFLLGNMSAKHNPFPAKIDSTWDIGWSYKNSGIRTDFPLTKVILDSIQKLYPNNVQVKGRISKDEIIVIARRYYKTVQEMDSGFEFEKTNCFNLIKAKHHLHKEFRWFFTYFTYRVTYPKMPLKLDIPIDKYMTKKEAQFWFTGKPNLLQGLNGIEMNDTLEMLDNKYKSWMNDNIWTEEFKALLVNYDKLSQKPVSKEQMKNLEDSIYNSEFNNQNNINLEKTLNSFFKTVVFSELWNNENSPMTKFENELSKEFSFIFQPTFNYKLILPGNVIHADGAISQSDTLIWRLSSQRLVQSDFIIEAQSRKANVWAFILSGIILLIAAVSFIWKLRTA